MPRFSFPVALILAPLLGCNSPTVCACTPPLTQAVIYGEVQSQGNAVPNAKVSFTAPFSALQCAAESSAERLEPPVLTDARGHFRAKVFSYRSPAWRCVRIVGSATVGDDSVVVDSLFVHFRPEGEQPDSLRVLLRLP